ncbi:MAG: TolC family protein [Bacteroidetes bacterium]|nr:TolC family protein [Bacteroidota bacterium]
MIKKIMIWFIVIWPGFLLSQNTPSVNLNQCLTNASVNYPLANQKQLLIAANNLKLQNIKTGFLPQFMLNGQVSYQSDVTSLPISIPGMNIPETSKDWYKLNVDISQLIYDGGALNKQKEFEQANTDIEVQNIEIALYKVKELVQTAYFNIILLNENKKAILLLQNELGEKLNTIISAVENGVMLASNRDNLMAELLKIEQNIFELDLGIESSIKNLNILTGLQLTVNDEFIIPETKIVSDEDKIRPELALFDLQISKISLLKEMTSLRRKPMVLGFGQAGFGRPALNMLSNDFEPYFVVGAKLSWKILDWGKTKNELKTLDIQSQMVNSNKEVFDTNLELLLIKKQSEIQRLESLILKDNQIVNLKRNVARASSSQFDNGLITSTEYLLEKNAETKAIMSLQLHQVQLSYAKIDYEYTMGKLN